MEISSLAAGLSAGQFALACLIAAVAATVKGITGFAMPMIMISGLASFLSPELALAGLILPTLVTNGLQALRDGATAAWQALRKHRRYFVIGGICLVLSAQLVTSVDPAVIYLMIGVPIAGFGLAQLLGWEPVLTERMRRPAEAVLGVLSGAIGGVSGVWGPPLVIYLTALGTPKAEQMRVQGVAFGLGAVLLTATHLQTGVLNARTLPFSAALLVPALLGLWAGRRLHDRLDQAAFRRATLVVLAIAGLNLVRRALL